jgi:L-lactate dehydrogenase complex protein LldG
MNAREEVLARIRAALDDDGQANGHPGGAASAAAASAAAASAAPASAGQAGPAGAAHGTAPGCDDSAPGYRTRGDLTGVPLLDLLADRLTDYRAVVRRTTEAEFGAAVSAALEQRGVRRVVVPPGLSLPGLPAGVETVIDDGLSPQELDAVDGVITGAAVAIAETGTIVLDASPDQGRRAISLVPDYHLCIVHAAQVVEEVPEGVARLAARAYCPLTWISGPSATSDIELRRVEGVHGPRTLEVILVG